MPTLRARRPSRAILLTIAVTVLVTLPAGVAFANHQFSDVPTGASFHDEVEALVGSGITAGCGAGKYCPGSAVTRGQMAQFLVRGLSRAAMSDTLLDDEVIITDGFVTVAAVTIEVGGVSGNQFVEVSGETSVIGAADDCGTCSVRARLRDADTGDESSTAWYRFPGGSVDVVGKSWVFSAEPGVHTYQLQVAVFETVSALTIFNPTVIATTHAFGSTGGSTLATSNE